jgi:hypothetical protein
LSEAVANWQASPSVVIVCSSPERLNLGFLTEGKQAAILITPSSWGSQLAGYLLHQIGSITGLAHCLVLCSLESKQILLKPAGQRVRSRSGSYSTI